MQEFLASFAVKIDEAGVSRLQSVLSENRELAAEDFLNDTVDAGDVGPNAQFTVAYEIVPIGSSYEISVPDLKYGAQEAATTNSSDWLTCSLRYRAFADNEVHDQQITVDAADATANPSDDWKFASCVIEFGMLAGHSDYAGTATVDSLSNELEAMNLNPERAGFQDLVKQAIANSKG